MFGTVARMKMKPGSFDKAQEIMKEREGMQAPGYLFSATFQSNTDPDEVWLVVGFEDEASYRKNAEDPETDKYSQRFMPLMAAPPEWHDGEIVNMNQAETAKSA